MKRSIVSRVREYFDTNRENVFELKPYLLKDGKKHPVAIICPGGGYRRICGFIEGHPYAKKLNAMGYHAIVVYYRVNVLARYPAPQDDLARAVRVVHGHEEQWNLDMTGYSVWVLPRAAIWRPVLERRIWATFTMICPNPVR